MMFTDSYLLSVTLPTGVHTADSYYSCSGRILQTQARLWQERAWRSSRCDQRKIAMLEEVFKTRDYSKVVKAQFICKSLDEKFGTAGMIIIHVRKTSRSRPLRIYGWRSFGTWNNRSLLMNPLLSWSKGCCWCKKTWHLALPLHQL